MDLISMGIGDLMSIACHMRYAHDSMNAFVLSSFDLNCSNGHIIES